MTKSLTPSPFTLPEFSTYDSIIPAASCMTLANAISALKLLAHFVDSETDSNLTKADASRDEMLAGMAHLIKLLAGNLETECFDRLLTLDSMTLQRQLDDAQKKQGA